jgi:hypothetical protein
MSHKSTELKSLTLFERKEYEELKYRFSLEAKRLRERAIFLGILVVTFIATMMMTGII